MELKTTEINAALGEVTVLGLSGQRSYLGVSTDTRADCREKLFVALAGDNFDGNAFLEQAAQAGATGAVIGHTADSGKLPQGLQYFRVPDTLSALQALAAHVRRKLPGIRTVAVTGSNGKSTTKALIASVLSRRFKTHATPGNFNNHVGVPLTLLGLEAEHEVLVAELGANHRGEIRKLARLVAPETSVITNVAPAHLEGFGSLEGVLRAKLELFEETAAEGMCIYCGDNEPLRKNVPGNFPRTLSFGLSQGNDVVASELTLDAGACPSFTLDGNLRINLKLPGRHNVLNALAAAAVGRTMGLDDLEIWEGLQAMRPLKMRGRIVRSGSLKVFDDSYNANPLSMREALATLAALEHDGPRAAVLGQMLELGPESEKLHLELAEHLAGYTLKLVVFVGEYAKKMKEACLRSGGKTAVFAAADADQAADVLLNEIEGNELILVKASRGVRLERVIEKLESRQQEPG